VPLTVATQVEVLPEVIEDGLATTVMPVTVGATFVTLIEADPATFVWPIRVNVAVHVPVPTPEGVNTPPGVIVPPVALHVTLLLKAPVPLTFATQVVVCEVLIEDGFAITETPVKAPELGAAAVLMVAVPDLVSSCVE
jgi:hypothetical protein